MRVKLYNCYVPVTVTWNSVHCVVSRCHRASLPGGVIGQELLPTNGADARFESVQDTK